LFSSFKSNKILSEISFFINKTINMKKVILLLAISSLLSTLLFAQSSPEGMNYQAVARNSKGEILANQPIALKVALFSMQSSGKNVYYNEVHDVVTSATGVFSLVVGKGNKESGVYENIPWALENVWMEVSIKSKGQADFAVISNSKLLAVPYAYHALTAEKITGENVANAGNPSQSWLLFGNRESNPNEDKLGTTDSVDLVIVTNNLERLRIYANGDIFMRRSLRIGANLTVDSSAYLNKLGGATINYGPFTVDRQSPTLLSGKLTVDKETDLNSSLNVDGITDLNSRLNVNNNSASVLTGTLRVDGITDLNNALNVNNVSPTVLTGTLRVDKDASFVEKIKVLSEYQTDTSGLNPSGSLQVGGGAYIKKNLYIGGIAKFGGPAAFGGAVTITDASESFSTSTGALIIPYGGVGIGKRLNVGGGVLLGSTLGVTGATALSNTLGVTGAATLSSTLRVTGATTLSSTLGVTGATTLSSTLGVLGATNLSSTLGVLGAANFSSTLGVLGATSLGSTLAVTGATTLNSSLNVTGNTTLNKLNTNGQLSVTANPGGGLQSQFNDYPLQVQGSNQGIAIRVNGSRANANNFISFWDGTNMRGRIEGETAGELANNPDYKRDLKALELDVLMSQISYATGIISVGVAAADVVAAASSSTGCVGLGACVTAPVPSLIIAAGINFIAVSADFIAVGHGLDKALAAKNEYVTAKNNEVGVTYQSGAGDYAEWIPKANPAETFLPGQIVGLKNGLISKNLEGAGKLFAISTNPIVLGNMPKAGNESGYEKVAFMGQVPVYVVGHVNAGDYILPSGLNNGLGIAVSPSKMKVEDYANIVGVAWSASTGGTYSLVNVAIGLNEGDISKVVIEQSKEIKELKTRINETNAVLAKLIPGFKEAAGIKESDIVANPVVINNYHTEKKNLTLNTSGADDIVYFEVKRNQVLEMIDMADNIAKESESDNKGYVNPFWKQMRTDPSFKEAFTKLMLTKFKNAMHTHKAADKVYLGGK
jgi:hypothetical protein